MVLNGSLAGPEIHFELKYYFAINELFITNFYCSFNFCKGQIIITLGWMHVFYLKYIPLTSQYTYYVQPFTLQYLNNLDHLCHEAYSIQIFMNISVSWLSQTI